MNTADSTIIDYYTEAYWGEGAVPTEQPEAIAFYEGCDLVPAQEL